ncbi:hypothetical protein, partial [Rhizobium johnstonii]|uniref:hypothetical protein n=1 Tax=Rhizobium johnstonii TaxID=3019933 RepID=UPI003F9C369B
RNDRRCSEEVAAEKQAKPTRYPANAARRELFTVARPAAGASARVVRSDYRIDINFVISPALI